MESPMSSLLSGVRNSLRCSSMELQISLRIPLCETSSLGGGGEGGRRELGGGGGREGGESWGENEGQNDVLFYKLFL